MGQYGSALEDKYFVQKVALGEGSSAIVWRAVDKNTGRVVAIKEIDKAGMRQRGITRAHIDSEISILKACRHSNIIRLYDASEDWKHIYLVLEYCDGGDLSDKIDERGASLGEDEAVEWMRQVISPIIALHAQDICHCDIKPDNFMVSGEHLKLSDFGLAVRLPRGEVLHEKSGTIPYMSPEQHALPNSEGYGLKVDIWAAGVLAFMIICGGRHPFLRRNEELDMDLLMRGDLRFKEARSFFSFDFMKATENRFSEEAMHFCRHLVNPISSSRPSAEEALQHSWLNGGSGKLATAKERQEQHDAEVYAALNPHHKFETELLSMGATPRDISEVRQWLVMGAEMYNVRQTMRHRLADRNKALSSQVSTVKGSGSQKGTTKERYTTRCHV